jgi:ParB/RepB/Spo0J family partition protein
MAATLTSVGQLHDVKVRPTDGGRYLMVRGHVRLAAAKHLGWPTIRGVIDDAMDDKGAKAEQVVENLARINVSPYNEALMFQDLISLGHKPSGVARLTGKAVNTIKPKLALLELPEAIGRKVGVDGFSMKHAKLLAPLADHPDLLDGVLAKLVTGNPEVLPVDAFCSEAVGFLVSKRLAIEDPAKQWYQYRPLDVADVRKVAADAATVTLKTATQTRKLVVNVDDFTTRIKAAMDEARAAEVQALRERSEDEASGGSGETKVEKKERQAAERKRKKAEKREAAIAKLSADLMHEALAERIGPLTPHEATWAVFRRQVSGSSPNRLLVHAAQALGIETKALGKLVQADGWTDGRPVVPDVWVAVPVETVAQLCCMAAVYDHMENGYGDDVVAEITGKSEDEWTAEATARHDGVPAGGEDATDEPHDE